VILLLFIVLGVLIICSPLIYRFYRFIFFIKINDIINSKVIFTNKDLEKLSDNLYGIDCHYMYSGEFRRIPTYLKYKSRLDIFENTLYEYCSEGDYLRFVNVCVEKRILNEICKWNGKS